MTNVVRIDRRTDSIHVPRASLSGPAENAAAANSMVIDAVDRALNHVWSGNRVGVIHELGRIGFEAQERHAALLNLTRLAETAVVCPDNKRGSPHGRAA